MPYRIVILNGELRGARFDVAASPLVIGKGADCLVRLSDPGCAETHAEVSHRDRELFIRSLGETPAFLVNETASRESRLKHGDVIQIGSTRFFVHEFSEQKGWDNFSALRKKRIWLTLAIPLLLVVVVATVVKCFHQERHKQPASPPLAGPSNTVSNQNQALPDDSVVTNIPRIQINPSVILTTKPPELVEAVMVLEQSPTHPAADVLDAAREELERGTRFLEEKSTTPTSPPTDTNRNEAVAELTSAEASLLRTTPGNTTTNLPTAPDATPGSNSPIAQ